MLFKQNKGLTYSLSDMVCLLFAFNRNTFESFEAADMSETGGDMLRYLRQRCLPLIQRIEQTGALDEDGVDALGTHIDQWLADKQRERENAAVAGGEV